ncbi:MAG: class I SAM-dependent methyltransferase [Thermoplasmata archaeon]
MAPRITRRVRAGVFGRDPGAFDRARLPYPRQVYEILSTRCGLRSGTVAFEIGPGTGIATRELLRWGAHPVTLIEPDRRLAHFLEKSLGWRKRQVQILTERFERAVLPRAAFDLGVAASSFHWTSERLALRRVARALKPGGWWAAWNSLHGDPYRSGSFRHALQPLYRELAGQRTRGEEVPRAFAARDRKRRIGAIKSVDRFDRVSRQDFHWRVKLDTARVSALWGTFSDVLVLPPKKRRWFLSELGRVVDEQFGGNVEIPVLTPLYTARRI